MSRTKKIIITACTVLVILLSVFVGFSVFNRLYIVVNEDVYSREITLLDISGTAEPELDKLAALTNLKTLNIRDTGISFADYDMLKAALPECQILWSVPFQEAYYDNDIETLTLSGISDEDLTQLAYFSQLQSINANGCRDYEKIAELIDKYPQIAVDYNVLLAGEEVSHGTASLTITDADAQELKTLLPYLPAMKNITLEGTLPEAEDLQSLTADFPNIEFYWQIELFGIQADVYTTELDFSNIPMETVETVENALGYLPSLERVIMCECGISDEEMDALGKRNPEVRFVWTVMIGFIKLRTDATAFMPIKDNLWPNDEEAYSLRYCVDMECLDLGHSPLTNCDFVAYMPNLKYLILALTNISDISPLANHDKLVYLELFTCRNLKDYTPLLTLTALEDLNICYTWGDIEIISQMTWLKNLWWSPGPEYKGIISERKKILSEALPNTYLELDTFSSTGEGWRKLQNYYEQRDIFEMPYFTY